MDFINYAIEESRWNLTIINGSKYTYVRKYAPHMGLKWSKREILNYKKLRSLTKDKSTSQFKDVSIVKKL